MGLFDKASENRSEKGLRSEWTENRTVTLEKEPDTVDELKSAVDVKDPGSVAAYWVYAVTCLTADYDVGMGMMKYLFAQNVELHWILNKSNKFVLLVVKNYKRIGSFVQNVVIKELVIKIINYHRVMMEIKILERIRKYS